MRSTRFTALFCTLVIAAGAACAEAGGEIRGGEVTPAGESATNPPAFNGDSLLEAAPCRGTGTHWSDLFNDIFGPTGEGGSCSLQSNCHGSPEAAGARSGSGIVCIDAKGCRQSILDKNLVREKDFATPEKTGLLLGILRQRRADGKLIGFMPQSPSDYLFSETCIARVKTWIANGAKDD